MNSISSLLLIVFLLMSLGSRAASNIQDDYQKSISEAKSFLTEVNPVINHFDLTEIPHYTKTPQQTKHYKNKEDSPEFDNTVKSEYLNSSDYQTVKQLHESRPPSDIESASEEIEKGKSTINHANEEIDKSEKSKKTFCLTGNCSEHTQTNDKDFDSVLTKLGVVQETGAQIDSKNPILFSGKVVECRKLPLSSLNCCYNKGVLKKLDLKKCHQSELDLAEAIKNELSIYVGEYCKKEITILKPVCLETRKVYCVFPSKLAEIIQRQGRYQQLNRSFGVVFDKTNNAHCEGIDKNDLQRLDFSVMNFEPLTTKFVNKNLLPSQAQLETLIKDKEVDEENDKKYQH